MFARPVARYLSRGIYQTSSSHSRRLLSSGSGKSVPFGTVRWIVGLGILPFGYYLGLSWREGEDDKAKFEKKTEEKIQARVKEKIAAHEEFLKSTEKYASK